MASGWDYGNGKSNDPYVCTINANTHTITKNLSCKVGDYIRIIGSSTEAGLLSSAFSGSGLALTLSKKHGGAYWVQNQQATIEGYFTGITVTSGAMVTGNIYLTVEKGTPTIPVNINGTWKEGEGKVNINGTWKDIDDMYINDNGTWKQV